MYLQIDDRLSIGDLEERFSDCFPYLRIAFYSKSHKNFEGSDKQFRYPATYRVGDVRRIHCNEAYEIKSWYTVSRVEKELREIYGLHAQIFRYTQDGGLVQTTLSDNFTLQQQNQFAMDMMH